MGFTMFFTTLECINKKQGFKDMFLGQELDQLGSVYFKGEREGAGIGVE